MGEDKVASFDGHVTGKARVVQRLIGGFTVFKLCEPPAARRGVFYGVLDHKLSVRGGSGHERLGTAKDFVVLLRRDVAPGEPGNDCAVRERKLPFPVGLDRHVIAQNGPQIVEFAFFVGHGDQPPVAVSGGNFDSEDRGSLSIGVSRWVGLVDDHHGQRYNCTEQVSDPSHTVSSLQIAYLCITLRLPKNPSGKTMALKSKQLSMPCCLTAKVPRCSLDGS